MPVPKSRTRAVAVPKLAPGEVQSCCLLPAPSGASGLPFNSPGSRFSLNLKSGAFQLCGGIGPAESEAGPPSRWHPVFMVSCVSCLHEQEKLEGQCHVKRDTDLFHETQTYRHLSFCARRPVVGLPFKTAPRCSGILHLPVKLLIKGGWDKCVLTLKRKKVSLSVCNLREVGVAADLPEQMYVRGYRLEAPLSR